MVSIIIPCWNYGEQVQDCILSAINQTYGNIDIYIIDDASIDGTYGKIVSIVGIDGVIQNHTVIAGRNIYFYKNSYRRGSLENQKTMIRMIQDPESIVCMLDGDDRLFDNKVIETIVFRYADKWCLWTQYVHQDGTKGHCSALPDNIYENRNYWVSSHLKTFKKHVFDRIREKDISGIPFAGDLAFMYPIIEMSGYNRCKFLDMVGYVYASNLPTNEHYVDHPAQREWAMRIRNKTMYGYVQ